MTVRTENVRMDDPVTLVATLDAVTTEKDQWHQAHQGKLKDIVGYVWDCGDDDCGCTQATILARFVNLFDSRWVVNRKLWEGEFHTDHEGGAVDELEAKYQQLMRDEPEMAARITWIGREG